LLLVAKWITEQSLQCAIFAVSPIRSLLVLHTFASVLRLFAGNKEENDDRLGENRLISAATDASGKRLSVCR
jgi:hypothetical protein